MEQDIYSEEDALQADRPDYFQEGLSLQPTPIKQTPSSGTSSKTPVLSCKGSSSGGGVVLVGTPLTPTANLKVLMSAVSPALREKERQERQQQGRWAACCVEVEVIILREEGGRNMVQVGRERQLPAM